MTRRKQEYKVTTRLVHGPEHSSKWDFTHHVTPPMSSSTTYRLDSARRGARGFQEYGRLVEDFGEPPVYVYDRLDEPTRSVLESELADLEQGEACVTFASGMAAISGALGSFLVAGDEVVAHSTLYGCTHSLLANWYPRLGIGVKRVDLNDLVAVRAAITQRTRAIYLESPVNPTLEIVDIAALRGIADAFDCGRPKSRRIRIVVDNTFATPFGQRPITLGADVVVHSLSKNLAGFGTEVGGAVIGPKPMLAGLLGYRKDFGAVLSSKAAWSILVYGLPTLALRLKRQQYTARRVATWLERQDVVRRVSYPGLESFRQRELAERQMRDFDGDFAPGNMISFELDPERIDAAEFVDAIARDAYSVTLAVSLGHTKTLIELPGSMTHSAYAATDEGAKRDLVRMSIGLESPSDIIADLRAAMHACAKAAV
jgi:cystathionine beta-lyase/cystathionine gamma-synthase